MLLRSIHFENFRALRDATLPLGRLTLVIGPNGSGKSTAMLALRAAADPRQFSPSSLLSLDLPPEARPALDLEWDDGRSHRVVFGATISNAARRRIDLGLEETGAPEHLESWLARSAVFSFDPGAIARPSPLQRRLRPGSKGSGLATVLTSIRDLYPENFETLTRELHRWLPDFDRILLDTVDREDGKNRKARVFMLRTATGRHAIPAAALSGGTLISIAMLTLAHMPEPPSIIGIEEPDRGIHPRLLREVQDAIFRLAHPERVGIDRAPVQVVITTHSPYMVDLFRDYPEDVVIARKEGLWGSFSRLTDVPHLNDLLRDAHLGDAWYSGVLGGVPAGT